MSERLMTSEESARVEEILDNVLGHARVELKKLAELLVTKPNGEFFGETEFLVRDAMHRIGSRLYDASLDERKKGGTADRAPSVRSVARI